jgi:hypothetical protein
MGLSAMKEIKDSTGVKIPLLPFAVANTICMGNLLIHLEEFSALGVGYLTPILPVPT